jgi:hypothetical protein
MLMATRRGLGRLLAGPQEWNRRRLQVLLAVAVLIATAVAAGVVWSVAELVRVDHDTRSSLAGHDGTPPALNAPGDVALPGPLSSQHVDTIVVPQPTLLGPAQVATGFPRTAEGALGQLIAIDQRAVGAASVVVAQDVIAVWAAPGGPTADSWSGVAAVRRLLESAGLPAHGSPDLTLQVDPAMGLIEDETDTTATVCVDFIVTAVLRHGGSYRIAVADCQHLAWDRDRWVIAAGAEAPQRTSVWPGNQASYDAGFRWLEIPS